MRIFCQQFFVPLLVFPAEAGIQSIQLVTEKLDSGFRRSDDFFEPAISCIWEHLEVRTKSPWVARYILLT
jgi:hypothetical protein